MAACVGTACAGEGEEDRSAQDGGAKAYAPGVGIDWSHRRVELDGRVVLREGALELFACSPHTREHESIVVVSGRPERIYQALGLVGATPGRPIRFDKKAQEWMPAAGDAVRVDVRYSVGGESRTVPAGAWMTAVGGDGAVPHVYWVFAGSTRDDQKRLSAGAEGTVACVVDFASALLALPESRTADNDSLWVRARTQAIPPIDTEVTLLLTPFEPAELAVRVGGDGDCVCDAKPVAMGQLAECVRRFQGKHGMIAVTIGVKDEPNAKTVERVEQTVREAVAPATPVRVRGLAGETVDRDRAGRDSDRP